MTPAPSERGDAVAVPYGPERMPSLTAQLGMTGAVSERAPQKYLIQNQTGLRLFYWADRVSSQHQSAVFDCKRRLIGPC